MNSVSDPLKMRVGSAANIAECLEMLQRNIESRICNAGQQAVMNEIGYLAIDCIVDVMGTMKH